MKRFVQLALLRIIAADVTRCCWIAAIALCDFGAAGCFAAEPLSEYLDVTLENISYQGNSLYKVDILIYNRSDKALVVKDHVETFLVQTEILGGWQKLSPSTPSGAARALISPRKGLRVAYILKIPLTIQSLYRNSEGDINMMFRYLIRFAPGSGAGLRSHSGEASYWITPETNTWVLREGM